MPRPPASAVLLLLVLAVGCTGGGDDGDGAAPTPTAVDTVAEVRLARDVVQQPAVDLHLAAQRVVGVVEEQRGATGTAAERLGDLAELPTGPFDDLEAAVAAVEELALEGRSDPVGEAKAALTAAAAAGRDVLAAARDDLATLELAADAEVTLLDMAGRWEAPGSRSQQLDRFAALATDAEALAGELGGLEPVADCLTTFRRRAAAADHVAAATRELRDHIEAYRGSAFDERRAELEEDPFGLERPLREADVAELGCWQEEAPVVVAAAAVDAALASLEDALNPDVATSPDEP